jgi:hypothetical protein
MNSKWPRRFLCIFAGLAAAVSLILLYGKICSGRTLQREVSPNGSVIAEVTESGGAAATDTNYVGVTLKTKLNPIRHYVYGGLDYGAHISVSWLDHDRLLISCQHCENLHGGDIIERKWHDVTVCYARSNVVEPPFAEDGKSCPVEP